MDENPRAEPGAERLYRHAQAGKTILLVDDDLISLVRLKMILERRGYRVIAEPEARLALALIQNRMQEIDLVITDYRMPDMDGLEFSLALKHASPGTPLILITAHSDIESYLKAISIGVLEYINKPVIANELLRIVNAVLDRNKDGDILRILTDSRTEPRTEE